MAHPGQPLDHQRNPVQGPQLTGEPISGGAIQQGLFKLGELGIRQPWRRAARSPAVQGLGAALQEPGVPDTHRLGGDAELAGDLGLMDSGGEQLGRAQPTDLESVTFLLCRRAARDSWLGRILACPAEEFQPDPRPHIPQPDTKSLPLFHRRTRRRHLDQNSSVSTDSLAQAVTAMR